MPCCPPILFEFVNEAVTTIPYTAGMEAVYGVIPKVLVRYFDPETGEYVLSTFLTRVSFAAGVVTVDHGGLNSGIVSFN